MRAHLHRPTQERGSGYVEILVVVAVVALGAAGAMLYFGGAASDKTAQQSDTVQCINGNFDGEGGCDGEGSSDGNAPSGSPSGADGELPAGGPSAAVGRGEAAPRGGDPDDVGRSQAALVASTPASGPPPGQQLVRSNDPDLDGLTADEAADVLRRRIDEWERMHGDVVDRARRAQSDEWDDYSEASVWDWMIRSAMDGEPPNQFRWDSVLFDNCMRQVSGQLTELGDGASVGDLAGLENQAKACLRAQLQRSGEYFGDYAEYLGDYVDSGEELVRDIGTTTVVVVGTVVAAPVVLAAGSTAAVVTAAGLTVAGGATLGCVTRGGINAAQGNDGFLEECGTGAVTGTIDSALTLTGVKAEAFILGRLTNASPVLVGMGLGGLEGPIDCALRSVAGVGPNMSLGSLATCAGAGTLAGGLFGIFGRPARRGTPARPGPNQPEDYLIRRDGFNYDVEGYGRQAAGVVDETLRRIDSGDLSGSDLREVMDSIAGQRRVIAEQAGDPSAGAFGQQRPRDDKYIAYTPIENAERYGDMLPRARELGDFNPIMLTTPDGRQVPLTQVGPGGMVGQGSRVGFYHAAGSSVEPALDHAQRLYNRALDPNLSLDETIRTVGELHWTLAHAMPYARGSAATTDMLARSVLIRRGIDPGPWRPGVAPDLEALVARDADEFADNYVNLFDNPPQRFAEGTSVAGTTSRAEGGVSVATIDNGVVTKDVKEVISLSDAQYRLSPADREIVATMTSDASNRLRTYFGSDVIPEFSNPAPGRMVTEYRGGIEYQNLSPEAQRRAAGEIRAMVNLGSGELGGSATGGFRAYVDTNPANFRFDPDGGVVTWFDPVVVRPPSDRMITPSYEPGGGGRFGSDPLEANWQPPTAATLPSTGTASTVPMNPTTASTVPNPSTASTVPMNPTTASTVPNPSTASTVPMDPSTASTVPNPNAASTVPMNPSTASTVPNPSLAAPPPDLDFDPGP